MGSKKISREQFEDKVAEVHGGLIVPMEAYISASEKIKFLCKVCGHVWGATPNNITRGKGCRRCADIAFGESRKLTQERFRAKVSEVHEGKVIPLEDHIGSREKVKFICAYCWNIWLARPDNIMHGRGCPQCKINKLGERTRLTRKEFEKELIRVHKGSIILGDKYINTGTNVDFICKKCGNRWSSKPSHITQGHGCPDCCDKSKGEEIIAEYLSGAGFTFKREVTFDGLKRQRSLRYDFAVLDKTTLEPTALIEFDGEQHFRPVEYFGGVETWESLKKSDEMKNQYARRNGIKLIRIPYSKISSIAEILNGELREVRLNV